MIRHGIAQSSAAGTWPAATNPLVPITVINAKRIRLIRASRRRSRANTPPGGLIASTQPLPGSGRSVADMSLRSKSP
jgi:hypothetical protein